MTYLGIIVSVIIYLTLIALFILYVGNAMFKKYTFANNLLPFLFLHSLFTIIILAWGLVVMNGGFDIEFNLKIDYTVLLFICIPIFLVLEVYDTFLRRKLYNNSKTLTKLYRWLLPTASLILFIAATIILYFNCNYFVYLITW